MEVLVLHLSLYQIDYNGSIMLVEKIYSNTLFKLCCLNIINIF